MTTRDALSSFELMVMLAIMRVGESAYGVPIAKELETERGRPVSRSSVYTALERLEEKGLVSSDWGEPTPERGGRAKRYFQVTARGLREVQDARRVLVNLWTGLPDVARGQA
jgi:DNA-binding PadR family transcriptional regulator